MFSSGMEGFIARNYQGSPYNCENFIHYIENDIYDEVKARFKLKDFNEIVGLNTPLSNNSSYLGIAVNKNLPNMVELLIENGAKIDFPHCNESVLVKAARSNYSEIVSILLKHKADMNANNNDAKETALIAAVKAKSYDAVKALVDAGATIRIKDKLGKTAFDYANEFGDRKLLILLDTKSTDFYVETIQNNLNLDETNLFSKLNNDTLKEIFSYLPSIDAEAPLKKAEIVEQKFVNKLKIFETIFIGLTVNFSQFIQNKMPVQLWNSLSNFVSHTFKQGQKTAPFTRETTNTAKIFAKSAAPVIFAIAAVKGLYTLYTDLKNGKSVKASLADAAYESGSIIVETGASVTCAAVAQVAAAAIGGAVAASALPAVVAGLGGAYFTGKLLNQAKDKFIGR